MAAFKSIFKITADTFQRNIVQFSYGLFVESSFTRQATSEVQANALSFTTVMAIGKADKDYLFNWIGTTQGPKNVTIEMMEAKAGGEKKKTIVLTNANIISYDTDFSSIGSEDLLENFQLIAKKIKVNDTEIDFLWDEEEEA